MSWAKFDDGAADHLKVRSAGTAPAALWFASVIWCARHATDGFVAKELLADVWRPLSEDFDCAGAAARLVQIGLWHDHGDRYEVHDFLEYNPSKADQDEKRRKEREKKRRQRGGTIGPPGSPPGTTQGTTPGTPPGSPPSCPPQDSAEGLREDCPQGSPGAPSRPVPSRPSSDQRARSELKPYEVAPLFEEVLVAELGQATHLGIDLHSERELRRAKAVIRWAEKHDASDPRKAAAEAMIAFADACKRGDVDLTAVHDPWSLFAARPGAWLAKEAA